MDLSWMPQNAGAPSFDNSSSPYAHYWLSMLPAAAVSGRAARLRSAVDLTERLNATTEELIARAFER